MELWMLGGDRRSPWTAQTLRAAGHAVHTFCVPSLPDETPPPEIERLILPMPCLRNGAIPGTRPLAPQEVLAHLRAGSRVYGGLLDRLGLPEGIRAAELYGSEPMTTRNAVATAEGAIAEAVLHSDGTLHGAACLVIGFGRVGLALAQRLGYAERNPAADVEGMDACRKICILASLAFGHHVYPDTVPTEGITRLTLADVAYAADAHCVIKLLGCAQRGADGKIQAITAPFLVPADSPLGVVDDVFNAVLVTGDATGDVLFYGKGAGKLPTASAVVADVIECAKHPSGSDFPVWTDALPGQMADMRAVPYRWYLRIAGGVPQALGDVTLLHRADAPADETALLTAPMSAAVLDEAAAPLTVLSRIRVANLG